MKTIKFTIFSALVLSFASTSINAQDDVSHNNAHSASGAEAIYNQWKGNKSRETDPFYRVARGYASDKTSASLDFFENQAASRKKDYISQELISVEQTINSRRSLRNESIQSAYDRATEGSEGEGDFDHDIYFSEMESYLEARNTSSGLYYEQRQSAIANVSINTNAGLAQINNSVLSNSSRATHNLVNLMRNKMSSKRADIYSSFEDNLADAELARAQGLAAQELAADFNNNCTACDFTPNPTTPPTPPPEPEPEPEPVYDPPLWCDGRELGGGGRYNRDPSIYYICP